MNIFATHIDPVTAASHHCDRHEPKMILESAQMLCSVHHRYGSTFDGIYKPAHVNHPCTLWAGSSESNYMWLYYLARSLNAQRVARGKQCHASFSKLGVKLAAPPEGIPKRGLTPFAQAMPDEFKNADVTLAYRAYLNYKFAEWAGRDRPMKATWIDRDIPDWIIAEDSRS